MAKRPEIGEWEVEPGTGRLYRKIGNCIEYEMMIHVDGMEVPQSQLEAHHARMRELRAREAAQREEERRKAEELAAKRKFCPLQDGVFTDCTREACALFLNDSEACALTRIIDRPPAKETEGLRCPLTKYHYKCRKDCGLYNKTGCTLTAIKTESEDN